jgi:aspartate dehydrogenase
MEKIGVVGCGTIGTQICLAVDQGRIPAGLIAVTDIDESRAAELIKKLNNSCLLLSLSELVAEADLIVEAAHQRIVSSLIDLVLANRKDVLIMSVGGLLAIESLYERFQNSGSHLYVPSGAIAGLDAIKAANLAGINRVTLTTRKPPQGLKGSSYCMEKGMDLENLDKEMIIFEGSAREAAKLFPQNINVAAALSLAGIGPDKTKVRIIADPETTNNTHEIEISGESGKIFTRTENLPSTFNPKTSYLAALSAIATLQGILNPIKVGS